MKTAFILFFILVILGLNAEAGAPYGIKGQEQSTLYSNVHQFPNKQVTNLGGINALVQDRNSSNNLLENCGFEHSSPATGWTLMNGSSAVDTATPKFGKQALKLTLTAQALDFYQTSTLNATAFADGVNGSISLAIKTTVDNVYLCRTDSAGAVVASTDGTKITNCVKISNSGKWGDYPLGIILGATSNGMRLVSLTPSTAAAVAVTGDVYVDQGILEAGLKATSQSVCTTTDCETEFSAKVSSAGVVSNENMNWINGNASLGTTGYTTLTLNSGLATVNLNCSATIIQGGFQGHAQITNQSVSSLEVLTLNTASNANTASDYFVVCQKQGADFTNAKALASGRFYTVPSDSFSTDTNALTWSASAITASSPIGTYNTYSYAINSNTKSLCTGVADPDILPNAADGFKIFTRAYNAASTCENPARVEIKIGAAGTKFPTIKTDIYKSAAKVTSGSLDSTYVVSTIEHGALINSYDESTGVLIIDLGERLNGTTTTAYIKFSDNSAQTSGFLVLSAQKAKDSIIGSFAEVVTSQGTTSPDIQSVYFGSGAACDSQCTTGTCTICNQVGNKITTVSFVSTGTYRLNGIDGTKYVCDGSANSASGISASFRNRSTQNAAYAELQYYVDAAILNASAATATCVGTK